MLSPRHGATVSSLSCPSLRVGSPSVLTTPIPDTAIAEMMITDTVAATQVARVHRSPKAISSRVVSLDMPGWLLAKTGFTVTWTLKSELPHDAEHRETA